MSLNYDFVVRGCEGFRFVNILWNLFLVNIDWVIVKINFSFKKDVKYLLLKRIEKREFDDVCKIWVLISWVIDVLKKELWM